MNDIFKVYDFENEQQWLKGRMNGIGGSDASAVVGMNPYKSNIDLFEEKIGSRQKHSSRTEEIQSIFRSDEPLQKLERGC